MLNCFKWLQIVSKDTKFCQIEVNYSNRCELIPNSKIFDSVAAIPVKYINRVAVEKDATFNEISPKKESLMEDPNICTSFIWSAQL